MSTLCVQTCGTHRYTMIALLSSRNNNGMTTTDFSTLLIRVFVCEILLILFKSDFHHYFVHLFDSDVNFTLLMRS